METFFLCSSKMTWSISVPTKKESGKMLTEEAKYGRETPADEEVK